MTRKRSLGVILGGALALTGCGVGTFTPKPTYLPASSEMKPLSTAGVGVLPIEDQRPGADRDSKGDGSMACIFLGALDPVSAHVEHIENNDCATLQGYSAQFQQQNGGGSSPVLFLRDALVKELSRANVLGPAKAVERPDEAPFTLKAVLKSSSLDARLYCLTPADTTWIFWLLGVPFAGYDFHLAMDLTLSGPDGKPLWTRTIDAKSSGVTSIYYDTGVTDENNLVKIYGDLLASQTAAASADLQAKLSAARPDVWRRANEFSAAARASAQAAAAQGEPAAATDAGGQGAAVQAAPWWK